jgi:hypothetical protein
MTEATMARDPRVEERLLRWAQWVTVGDSSGYPMVSVLHKDWMPPSPGQTCTPRVLPMCSDGPHTHRAIGTLPVKLRNVVVRHYVNKMPMSEHALLAGCQVGTISSRLDVAHQRVGQAMGFCNIVTPG